MHQPRPCSHVTDIHGHDTVVRIDVGGTLDGHMTRDPVGYGFYGQHWQNMISVRLENIGVEAVENPWIVVDGHHRWRSLEEIVAGLVTADMDDKGKAHAIWNFARHHRYHSTTGDDEVKDTVKMLNVYGYTLCWDEAYTVSNLWQAAGLKVRRGFPHGHCTSEVFYDGAYHLLDSDEHLMVLDRDNRTVASEAQISHDHDLMKRSHAYGILAPQRRETAAATASVFCHTGPRSGGRARIGDHRMQITLRPGEALAWGWTPRGKYHGFGKQPPLYANGRLEWEIPVGIDGRRWAAAHDNLGQEAGVLVAKGQGEIIYQLRAPYVLVGGEMSATLQDQIQGQVTWALRCGSQGDWIDLDVDGSGAVSLDAALPPTAPACYQLQIRLRGHDWRLQRLHVAADLQMAPLSLPSLRLGRNQVQYTDSSEQRRMRLTCAWLERDDWSVPAPPTDLGASGATSTPTAAPTSVDVATSQPRLHWAPVDDAVDYHLRLGPDDLVDDALSPVFDKLLSNTPEAGTTSWTVPEEGLLNPATDYYWKVRARSQEGAWGPWSTAAHLRLHAPGVPLSPRLTMDWEHRQGVLSWLPNPQGEPPVAYEIHGSDECGFSAHREPYELYLGNQADPQRQIVPGNLIAEVAVTAISIAGPAGDFATTPHLPVIGTDLDIALQHPFYRVVAVDAAGVRSGSSDFVAAPLPFVLTAMPSALGAGQTACVELVALCSRGALRAKSDGPRRYQQTFRDGDVLSFGLDEGPSWIDLDTISGRLRLSPPATGALGTHTVTLRIDNGQGGVDVIGFDVEVHDGYV